MYYLTYHFFFFFFGDLVLFGVVSSDMVVRFIPGAMGGLHCIAFLLHGARVRSTSFSWPRQLDLGMVRCVITAKRSKGVFL